MTVQPAPQPEVPDPVSPSLDLLSATWWQWAITTVVALGIAIGTLTGHPFDSTVLDAIVPSVALIAASIATAIQVHGVHTVRVAQLTYEREIRLAQMKMVHEERMATLYPSGTRVKPQIVTPVQTRGLDR